MTLDGRHFQIVAVALFVFALAVALGTFAMFVQAGFLGKAATFAGATVLVSAFGALGFALAAVDEGDDDD